MALGPDDISRPDPEPSVPKGRKLPYMPDREASFSEMRQWLSNAIGLPKAVRVESVIRYGRGDEDVLTIGLSNDTVIRCDRQKRLMTPASLQSFFTSESDGMCRPQYLSRPECGEVYMVLCALATAAAAQDDSVELRERLESFVLLCEPVFKSLVPEFRYETLRALQSRPVYDRLAATEVKRGRALVTLPVVLSDSEWSAGPEIVYLIRHSEFITQLRSVHMQVISDSTLKGRMQEIGCVQHTFQGFSSGRAHHVSMILYQLPGDIVMPHLPEEVEVRQAPPGPDR